MNLLDLLKLGTEELTKKALAGELSPKQLWTAIKGANTYRAAMAAGNICSEAEGERRAAICAQCPSRVEHRIESIGATAGYCGKPFEAKLNADPPVCGCLVTITVNGSTSPAAKTMVQSEQCPQGKWKIDDKDNKDSGAIKPNDDKSNAPLG